MASKVDFESEKIIKFCSCNKQLIRTESVLLLLVVGVTEATLQSLTNYITQWLRNKSVLH